ncbi:MAG: shikimate kinase [Saccharofermentanales bacterium]
MYNKKNIILIGMPGCGKSTIGVVLAKAMGYKFIDTDLLIQEREKRLLSKIIEDETYEEFIRIENEINKSIKTEKTVIATGGSAIYGLEAMEHFRKYGFVIYLKLPYKDIEERVGEIAARGILMKKGQTLKDLYQERTPLYEKYANLTIDIEGKTIREAVETVGTVLAVSSTRLDGDDAESRLRPDTLDN